MFFDPMWLLLLVVSLGLGFGTQIYIKNRYKHWSRVPISTRMTGAQAARRMLDENGLHHVAISVVAGELSDHYDPRTNVVSLSRDVYSGTSVSATAIACHECGHAVQHARGFVPVKLRTLLVPPINFASNIWMFVLLGGIFFQVIGLIWVAIALYSVTIVFQLVTLPVEFDASRRAMAYVSAGGALPQSESAGARQVLSAAALTYVAAALVSVLQLIYLLGLIRGSEE